FTYDDLWSPVRGLALVDGKIWLNYEEVSDSDQVIRVIDPATGAVADTFGNTGIELSAMGTGGRALVSHAFDEVDVVDTSSGGTVQAISTSFMDGGTQQGVAWRPGEIWVGGWLSPLEIYNEAG